MQECNLHEKFTGVVKGFADSYRFLRKILAERVKEKRKFNITSLMQDYLPEENSFSLHNAVDDVQVLKKLLQKLVQTEDVIKQYTESISEIDRKKELKAKIASNKASFGAYKEILSNSTISKLAVAGITFDIMKETFDKNGKDGLYLLCAENINNKPRVTKNVKILNSIYGIFVKDIPKK